MIIKRNYAGLIIILYVSMMILCCKMVSASELGEVIEYENGKYELGKNGWNLLKYNGRDKKVTLPNTIENIPVTQISSGAFNNNHYIENINIPVGIKRIEGNVLTRKGAFYNCESLMSVIIPEGIEEIEGGVFKSCNSLEKVVLPSTLKTIRSYAFDDSYMLSDVNFPEGLERIESWAFAGVLLYEVRFGKNISYIDNRAFPNVHELEAIYVDEDNPYYSAQDGVLFDKEKTILYICPMGKKGTYHVPSSVKRIDDEAFSQSGLSEIVVSEGVGEIGRSAFETAWEVATISIPSTVKEIDDNAFVSMWGLETIRVSKENQFYISVDGVMYTKDMKKLICYPARKKETVYSMPEGVESAVYRVFKDTQYLTTIKLPSTFSYYNSSTFYFDDNKVERIEVSEYNSVFSSEDGVLYTKNKDKLICYPVAKKDEIYIVPESVKVIGENAIYEQYYLKKLFIQEGTEIMQSHALRWCENLEYISIPKSMSTINISFFVPSNRLRAISVLGNIDDMSENLLENCNSKIYYAGKTTSDIFSDCVIYDYAAHEREGHRYEEEMVYSEREDCKLYTCNICGHMEKTTICRHDWNSQYTIDKDKTCITNGSMSSRCNKCNVVKKMPIYATGHDFDEWEIVEQPECDENGIKKHVCTNCGHIGNELIEKTGHDYDDWKIVQEPTCEEKGNKKRSCKKCGLVEAVWIDATGHDWNEFYTVDKKATCAEDGSESIHCANCDATEYRRVIRANRHEEMIIPGAPADCVNKGLTEGKVCLVCNKVTIKQQILPTTDHNYGEWVTLKEPTCEKAGEKERVCLVCGNIESVVTEATGHDWNSEYTIDKEASYTGEGSKSIHCKKCLSTKDFQMIDKLVEKEEIVNITEKQIIQKKVQTITVSKKASKTVCYKVKNLKKKKVSFDIAAKAEGRITYKVTKGAKYISVSKKGKVTIKKKTKRGTYKILVTASDTARSFGAKRYIYIKIK